MFGPVKDAQVTLYPILETGLIDKSHPIGSSQTDANGNYEIKIQFNKVTNHSTYIVQATGGSYVEEASNKTIYLTSKTMSSLITSLNTSVQLNSTIGPLTEIAYQVFQNNVSTQLSSGKNVSQIAQNTNTQISNAFGLKSITDTIPVSPTGTISNDEAGKYTMILAALSKAADNVSTDSIALMNAYGKHFSDFGNLKLIGSTSVSVQDSTGQTVSITPVSLADLSNLTDQIGKSIVTINGLTPPQLFNSPIFNADPAATTSNNVIDPTSITPNTPIIKTVSPGDTEATISFYESVPNGSAAVTCYRVTSTPDNKSMIGLHSPIKVTGLQNGVYYKFKVSAINPYHESALSDYSTSILPASLAGAPTIASVTAGDESATVDFSPPTSDGGTPITSYIVTSSPGGLTAIGTSSPITIIGLTNGTTYTFSVKAINEIGTGPSSALSAPVIPATVPGAPIIGTAVAGTNQVTVNFKQPNSNGGLPILYYIITTHPTGTTTTLTNVGPLGSNESIVITGLTNGTQYTFSVTAVNAVGMSASSNSTYTVIPAGLPDAPIIGSATFGNAQASIAFSPPSTDGGSPIIYYLVTSYPGGQIASGTSSPITVVGLTNGTAYTFTVKAMNKFGAGPESSATNSITPSSLLNAPLPIGISPMASILKSPPSLYNVCTSNYPSDTLDSDITKYIFNQTNYGLLKYPVGKDRGPKGAGQADWYFDIAEGLSDLSFDLYLHSPQCSRGTENTMMSLFNGVIGNDVNFKLSSKLIYDNINKNHKLQIDFSRDIKIEESMKSGDQKIDLADPNTTIGINYRKFINTNYPTPKDPHFPTANIPINIVLNYVKNNLLSLYNDSKITLVDSSRNINPVIIKPSLNYIILYQNVTDKVRNISSTNTSVTTINPDCIKTLDNKANSNEIYQCYLAIANNSISNISIGVNAIFDSSSDGLYQFDLTKVETVSDGTWYRLIATFPDGNLSVIGDLKFPLTTQIDSGKVTIPLIRSFGSSFDEITYAPNSNVGYLHWSLDRLYTLHRTQIPNRVTLNGSVEVDTLGKVHFKHGDYLELKPNEFYFDSIKNEWDILWNQISTQL